MHNPRWVGVRNETAALHAAGKAVFSGLVSARVAVLTEGVLKAMLLTKLKTAALVLAACLAFTGTGFLVHQARGGKTAPSAGQSGTESGEPGSE